MKLYLVKNNSCCNFKEAYIFASENDAKNFLKGSGADFELIGQLEPVDILRGARTNIEFNSLSSQFYEFLDEEEILSLEDQVQSGN